MTKHSIKKQVRYLQNMFHDLLNDFGQVFIVVKYSGHTMIGNRGFTEEEKEKGLVLVFNQSNYSKLQWTQDGSIVATLGFGDHNRPEKCLIHYDDIMSVFSPRARVRFDRWDMWKQETAGSEGKTPRDTPQQLSQGDKVVSLNGFRKTKK